MKFNIFNHIFNNMFNNIFNILLNLFFLFFCIFNIMNEKINNIYKIYKNELKNYVYVEENDILSIPLGSSIKYISKNTLMKKGGFLKEIKDSSILELINPNKKRKWYIYTDKNYIFYNTNTNKLKDFLQTLVESDFKDLKIKKNT